MSTDKTFIYGKHPVKEALKMRPDVVSIIFVEKGNDDPELESLIEKHSIPKNEFTSKTMPKGVVKDVVHQGVVAGIDAETLMQDYDDYIGGVEITNDTSFVILGEVNDPQNVGAVIRSAAAFGVSAVLVPEHRQVQVTGAVLKASAGMAFHIPVVSIGNVNHTIKDLKERGCWVYGLDGKSELSVSEEKFEKPSVFVLGNEGSGIREKTLEHCDILLRIPIKKDVESLNASVSAGIVFYAWQENHKV